MTFAEVIAYLDSGEILRFERADYSDIDGICAVNGLMPMSVALIKSIQSDLDIEVLDESGRLLGLLCCCQHLGSVDINSMTDAKYAAYINEIRSSVVDNSYKFEKTYFVVLADRYEEYKRKYLESAPLWGGFLHECGEIKLRDTYKIQLNSITAIENVAYPTTHHKRISAQSVIQPYAYERYLKLYHLFELLFDFDVVKEIQGLGDNLDGIGKILANYEREELDRLKSLMSKRCNKNVSKIELLLNNINKKTEYLNKGKEIYFKYGKEGNPFKGDKEAKFDRLIANGGFSEERVQSLNMPTNNGAYEKLIIDTAAYWIYRIRCCVAHTRIGEYVLVDDDEEFVCEVIEPLIREALCQSLQK